MSRPKLLVVQDLTIRLGDLVLVEGVSFDVDPAGSLGLVGESGSGKTLTLKALMGLLPHGAHASGSVRLDGEELLGRSERGMSSVRGAKLGLVLQDPLKALNPIRRVGVQIAEAPRLHLGLSRAQARERAHELMHRVGLPDPETTARRYPHQLSGGMRQRVMIAIALSCDPKLVLCDEPTTALDVTVQAQVLRLLQTLCREQGTAMVFVSHDLAVVRQVCTDLAVMYSGRLVETGRVDEVFDDPRHAYTASLLRALPDVDHPTDPQPISGEAADPRNPPSGCRFHPRCPVARSECLDWPSLLKPALEQSPGHRSACIHAERGLPELAGGGVARMTTGGWPEEVVQ